MSSNARSILNSAIRPQASSATYAVGDRIVHTSFGKGTVTEVMDQGRKVRIQFKDEIGSKVLISAAKAFRKINEGEE